MDTKITCFKEDKIETFSFTGDVSSFIEEQINSDSLIMSNEYIPVNYNKEIKYYENNKCLKIYIPKQINYFQMIKGYQFLIEQEKNKKIQNYYLYNKLSNDNYDFYDNAQNPLCYLDIERIQTIIHNYSKMKSFSYEQVNQIVNDLKEKTRISNIFLEYSREKLEILSKQEEEMFYKYRTFDLEYLLCSDEALLYPINCDNAGCISIFKDNFYATTVTKMQHGEEFKNHLRKEKMGDFTNVFDTPDEKQVVLIQIIKKKFLIWLPSKLTMFQKNTLLSYLEKLKELKVHCPNFEIETNQLQDASLDEIISMIQNYPELIEQLSYFEKKA